MNPDPITVVNIVSTSYSGSTWVNMLLGSHSTAFSIGSIDWIGRVDDAVCSLHGRDCPLWSQYDPKSPENPFVQIARLTGKRVLIVSNTRKFRDAQKDPAIRSRYVWLVRDGRAVAASTLRKYPEVGAWRASRNWKRTVRKNKRLLSKQDPASVLSLRYEEVVTDTEAHVRRACEFLGLEFEPAMLKYYEQEQHLIGGNIGTVSVVAQRQNVQALHNALIAPIEIEGKDEVAGRRGQWDLTYYRQNSPDQFVDERWKQEMSDRQLLMFRLAAGRMNRKLGYPAGGRQ